MNTRRGFLTQLAGLGMFAILPSAVTYDRIWKAVSLDGIRVHNFDGLTINSQWGMRLFNRKSDGVTGSLPMSGWERLRPGKFPDGMGDTVAPVRYRIVRF